jgi:hypothetical protein
MRILLQVLNVVALGIAITGGMMGGALGLRYAVESLGLPSNFGVSIAGIGLGGLAGFFLWAIPQMPRRNSSV